MVSPITDANGRLLQSRRIRNTGAPQLHLVVFWNNRSGFNHQYHGAIRCARSVNDTLRHDKAFARLKVTDRSSRSMMK